MAHNIYSPETHEFHFDFRFYSGACGSLGKSCEVEDFFIPNKFILNADTTHDYCLIKLKEKVDLKKFIPLSGDISSSEKKATILISGYQ